MSSEQEVPVFFDGSGRRWKWIQKASLVGLAVVAVLAYQFIPIMLQPAPLPTWSTGEINKPIIQQDTDRQPQAIAYNLGDKKLPVIGSGGLVKIIKIHGAEGKKTAIDPFSDAFIRKLDPAESQAVQQAGYAIERYGQTQGKRIALTFDDGPDPAYTPQILDILSKENAPSTFFATGDHVAKYSEIANRMTSEGHIIGNHTFTHLDFDYAGGFRSTQDINQTQRIITAATGHTTGYFRLPYGGNDDESLNDNKKGILEAQRLGYAISTYDIDTKDWQFPNGTRPSLPQLDGNDKILLLHDSGGDRSKTIPYLQGLISAAKAEGYTFVNLDQLYQRNPPLYRPVHSQVADKISLFTAQVVLLWPKRIINVLFIISVWSIIIGILINVTLAARHMKKAKSRQYDHSFYPFVTVLIPAYNEEKVLRQSVASLLSSEYQNFEIVVIDDGSKDHTAQVIRNLAIEESKVRGIFQQNGGKSAALNQGIESAQGDIIISADADTIFLPSTLGNLVRHFNDPNVGAVAGSIKVGNSHQNFLTRWQGLEYITSINIERNAQAQLNAILIVPGACSAWRKDAIVSVGGHSSSTLAEDCDLTLSIHRVGFTVVQDNQAVSYTEAPANIGALAKQRFRWTFGNIQSFWKHRNMLFSRHHGWLGSFVFPISMFNMLMPLVFLPVLTYVAVENIFAGRFHIILVFACLSLVIQIVCAIIGLLLARESFSHLLGIPVTKLIYSPLRVLLLGRSIGQALKGSSVGWNKLKRTGSVMLTNKPLK